MRRGRPMSKSVAPELRDYLRTKFAEPSALDMFNQYAPNAPGMPAQTPSLAGLTREEIAAAGDGLPRTIGEKYNPFTPEGRDRILDWGANTDTVKAISDYGRDTWEYAQKNPLSRFVYNAPGAVAVATEAATNPTNADRPVSAAIEAVSNAGKPAPTASISAPPATPDTTTGGKQTSIFPLDNTTAYGLGGAGAGALLGAAMSRKGKRGRNALLGAGLGGGAGLLAQYLMSQPGQQKTSMHTKSATNMLHDALGTGAGGAVIGGLYGALTARKKKLLRSTLRGALIGGGTGTALGAGASAFGNPVGPTTDNPSAAEHAGFNRGFGSAAAGGLGAALSQRLADEYLPLEDEDENKQAALDPALIAPLTGAAVGGGIGALTDKKKRLRNAMIGAAAGGGIGGAAEFALPGIGLGGKYRVQDFFRGHPAKPTNWANTLGRVPEIGEYAGRRESNLPGLQLLYGVSAGEATRTPLDDLGDAAAPYTKRVEEGVKKLDENVRPWLDWFSGEKPQ